MGNACCADTKRHDFDTASHTEVVGVSNLEEYHVDPHCAHLPCHEVAVKDQSKVNLMLHAQDRFSKIGVQPESYAYEEHSTPANPTYVTDEGPYVYPNHQVYYGGYKYGQMHGVGCILFELGNVYYGNFRDDQICGAGAMLYSDGSHYKGEWANNLAEGHGTLTETDGVVYTGSWVNNVRSGHGVEQFNDDCTYKGDYKDGLKNGDGYFTWKDGSEYRGNFVNGDIEGKGVYWWADERRFEGDWVKNEMHGHGVFTWKDGRKYVGEYVADKKEGSGRFTWPARTMADGSHKGVREYQGGWNNGKQHGLGVIIDVELGKEVPGKWEDGVKVSI
jgi:hypothetical protein